MLAGPTGRGETMEDLQGAEHLQVDLQGAEHLQGSSPAPQSLGLGRLPPREAPAAADADPSPRATGPGEPAGWAPCPQPRASAGVGGWRG